MIIKTDKNTTAHYFEDSSGMLGAFADKVYIPENKQDVIDIIEKANQTKTPITVAAGCTGVTGGCLAYGGAVLSTEKLNDIGINRLSIGIQTFGDKGRKFLNRVYNGKQAIANFTKLRENFGGLL